MLYGILCQLGSTPAFKCPLTTFKTSTSFDVWMFAFFAAWKLPLLAHSINIYSSMSSSRATHHAGAKEFANGA